VVDVVYSNNDITVIGGPTRLDLDLNIGPSGTRGSFIFQGNGNPNLINPNSGVFSRSPEIFDLFIDSDPASPKYLQAYQFLNKDGVTVWEEAFKLSQSIYNVNKVVRFTAGNGETSVNLSGLGLDNLPFNDAQNSSFYFNVTATISNIDIEAIGSPVDLDASHLPSAVSVLIQDVVDLSEGSDDSGQFPAKIPIKLKAVEFSSGTWAPINEKDVLVYLSISFADPTEILNRIAGTV
jgi:hypothetical protein